MNHVRQRYINAEAIHPKDITEEEPGVFKVKKQTHEEGDSKEFYCVRFWGENELPSCECNEISSHVNIFVRTGNEISSHVNIFVRFSCQNLPGDGRHFPAFTNPIIF